MAAFKYELRDWTEYRALPGLVERDFHFERDELMGSHWEDMQMAWNLALTTLQDAQRDGKQYVLFTHGWSTSGPGRETFRSQVRKLMRDKIATPYLIRRDCIQHDSVFVAAIRPLKPAAG